ncbi:DUF501 domain-containing protein [Bogoriella caseilytica]|uniref:DUF501 domain-containing protein n=1 Tax=Bogoriella caseilytica TaxID=56055 RepID=A0A3N2BAP0_9MICO|nr:DUF501 domain-containing protein [Bogoriella caseilytica]ROR72232.1 hypothetical protein EDD31_0581 [Bogoriella caseilytica]
MTAPELAIDSPVSERDRDVLREQLGRVPRGLVAVAARDADGAPLVVRTAPRLDDGTPFPTSYYLTHPVLVKAVSTLEATKVMEGMNARLAEDAELAERYAAAHQDYLRRRAELASTMGLDVPEIESVSAGGMPSRVKCLHALLGHTLAVGEGLNPFGDETLQLLREAGSWGANGTQR